MIFKSSTLPDHQKRKPLRCEKERCRQEVLETERSYGEDKHCQLRLTRLESNKNKISIEVLENNTGTEGFTGGKEIALISLIAFSAKIDQP